MSEKLQTRTITTCLACGAEKLEPLAMKYVWREHEFPAGSCPWCGMRSLTVQPVGETLASMYSAEYFEVDFRCGRADANSFDEAAWRAENAGLLDAFEKYKGGGRLLEIGCASGWLLKHAAERGWKVTGVEYSADAAAHAQQLGVDVHVGALEDAKLPAGGFDLVYMGDVLEHVPDCRDTSERVAALLAPGGHFYLRGPITTNTLARQLALQAYATLGRSITLREPPYHLWEFTPTSLRRLMKQVGLKVVEMRESKIAPGSAGGRKRGLQRSLMAAIDGLNVPLTNAFNAWGDRVVMVAEKPKG